MIFEKRVVHRILRSTSKKGGPGGGGPTLGPMLKSLQYGPNSVNKTMVTLVYLSIDLFVITVEPGPILTVSTYS